MCSTTDPLEQLAAALTAVAQSQPPLCERPARAAALAKAAARAQALYLRELGQCDASGELDVTGAPSTATWVRRETGRSERDAQGDVTLSRRLRRMPLLAAAFGAGELQPRTVELVARVADQLPADLLADTEEALVDAARLMPYEALRRYLKEKLAQLAPERLKDAIKSAYERRRLFLDDCGDMTELRGSLEPLEAERFEAVLNAIMESDRRPDDPRSRAQRRADALAVMVELVSEHPQMPQVRDALPHLIVIREEGRPAHTTGGNVLSDEQLDLVECAAVRTEVTVGRGRRPLDVGRSTRSLSRRLWLAVVVRDDGHCQVAGCSQPASRCVPHHIVPWRLGGPTDLDNLVLICVAHHHALHDRELHLQLYDGRVLTPTGALPNGHAPPPHLLAA